MASWQEFAHSHVSPAQIESLEDSIPWEALQVLKKVVSNAHIEFIKTGAKFRANPEREIGYSWSPEFDQEYHALRKAQYDRVKTVLKAAVDEIDSEEKRFEYELRNLAEAYEPKTQFGNTDIYSPLFTLCNKMHGGGILNVPALIEALRKDPTLFCQSIPEDNIDYEGIENALYEEYEKELEDYVIQKTLMKLSNSHSKEWRSCKKFFKGDRGLLKDFYGELEKQYVDSVNDYLHSERGQKKIYNALNNMGGEVVQTIQQSLSNPKNKKTKGIRTKKDYYSEVVKEYLDTVQKDEQKMVDKFISKNKGVNITHHSGQASDLIEKRAKSIERAIAKSHPAIKFPAAKSNTTNNVVQSNIADFANRFVDEVLWEQVNSDSLENGYDIAESEDSFLQERVKDRLVSIIYKALTQGLSQLQEGSEGAEGFILNMTSYFAYKPENINSLITGANDMYHHRLTLYTEQKTDRLILKAFQAELQDIGYAELLPPNYSPERFYCERPEPRPMMMMTEDKSTHDVVFSFWTRGGDYESRRHAYFVKNYKGETTTNKQANLLELNKSSSIWRLGILRGNSSQLGVNGTISPIQGPLVVSGVYNGVWKIINDLFVLLCYEFFLYPSQASISKGTGATTVPCVCLLACTDYGFKPSTVFEALSDWASSHSEFSRISCANPQKVASYMSFGQAQK